MDLCTLRWSVVVMLMASLTDVATSTLVAQVPIVWEWTASQPEDGFQTGDQASMRLLYALEQRHDVDFRSVRFKDAFRHLSDTYEVPIRLDESAMDDETVDGEELITLSLRSIRLKDALKAILSPLNLTHTLSNESILVTNQRNSSVIGVLYDIDAITVEPDPTVDSRRLTPFSLAQLIENSIAMDEWANAGGTSTINPFLDAQGGRKLLVVASLDAQESLQSLLRRLAKGRAVPSPSRFNAWNGVRSVRTSRF